MARIELSEPRPRGEVVTRALLRAVAGVIVFADGLRRLFEPIATEALLARLGVDSGGMLEALALSVVWGELIVGACTLVGLFTRTAAFGLSLGSVLELAGAVATAVMGTGAPSLAGIALAVVLLAYALSLLVEGGGVVSVDHARAERARRKAIAEDPIWSRPPYAVR